MFAITLHIMLRISTRRVLGFYRGCSRPALSCRQKLPNLVVGLQTVTLPKYAQHHVSNVHDKFQCYTVGVQAAMMIYNNPRADLGVCLHTQCMPLRSI